MSRASAPAAQLDDTDFPFGHSDPKAVAAMTRLDEKFAKFHLNNPDVYSTLCELAREAKSTGHSRCSMKMLYEVARWRFWLRTTNHAGFVLDNNFTSRYARLLMKQESDLAHFFDIRELRS